MTMGTISGPASSIQCLPFMFIFSYLTLSKIVFTTLCHCLSKHKEIILVWTSETFYTYSQIQLSVLPLGTKFRGYLLARLYDKQDKITSNKFTKIRKICKKKKNKECFSIIVNIFAYFDTYQEIETHAYFVLQKIISATDTEFNSTKNHGSNIT